MSIPIPIPSSWNGLNPQFQFHLIFNFRFHQNSVNWNPWLGSQCLNVVPCKNLGLKLDDQQLRISIGFYLGANICVAHTCHCGKRVERDGLHGLSCTKSAGRFSRHATLNSLIKQTLGSLDLPSMLEPRGLYRTDGKPPDGVAMTPWEMGKELVWDVTFVDALAPSRLHQGSLCNPGTTVTETESRKIENYCELKDNGYILHPVQGSSGKSSEIFDTRLCNLLVGYFWIEFLCERKARSKMDRRFWDRIFPVLLDFCSGKVFKSV